MIDMPEEWSVEINREDECHIFYCNNPKSALLLMGIVAEQQGFSTKDIVNAMDQGMDILEVEHNVLTLRDSGQDITIHIDCHKRRDND